MKRFLLLFVLLAGRMALFGQVNFTYDKIVGCGPMTVAFQGQSNMPGTVVSWKWSFGDGDTSLLQNPVHTYNQPGVYKVSLIVLDDKGGYDYKEINGFTVVTPQVDIGYEYLVCTMNNPTNKVTIKNKLAPAADPGFGRYTWSTGDTTASISVNAAGTYRVTYEVCGTTLKDSVHVSVANSPASLSTATADNWFYGMPANLYVNIPFNRVTIAKIIIDWKDGTVNTYTDYGDVVSTTRYVHMYQQPGTYPVTFTTQLEQPDAACDTIYTTSVTIRPPAMTVSLGNDTILYKGDTLVLDAGPGADKYEWWSDGANTQTSKVTTSGYYRVLAYKNNDIVGDSIHVYFIDIPANITEAQINVWKQECQTAYFIDSSRVTGATIQKREWDFGDGTTATDTQSPSHTYMQNGTYTVRLIVTNNYHQRDTAYTTVTINTMPELDLGADTTLIVGDTLMLSAPYTGHETYQWSTGDTTWAIGATQPGTYWVNVNYCGGTVSDTIHISQVISSPTAQFTASKLQCTTMQLTDQSTTPAGTTITFRQWNFGDNTTDTAINPLHTYSQPGTYTVSLLVENSYGKRDTAFTTIQFSPVAVNLGADTTLAAGDSLLLDARRPEKLSNATYLWSTGDTTPVKVVYAPGNYWVNVTACGTTVTDTIYISLTGTPPPDTGSLEAGLALQQTACRTYRFTDTSKVTVGYISRRIWQFGDNTTDTLQNPVHIYSQSGTYIVKLLVEDNAGQQDSASAILTINSIPAVNLGPDIDTLHPGGSVQLNAFYPATANYSFQWSTGDTTQSITVTQPGTYALKVTDRWCGTSAADTIQVFADSIPAPGELQARFTAGKLQCTTVQFTDQSTTPAGTAIASRQWSFGDNTTDTAINPLHTYSRRGTYTISLLVENSNGERDTAFTTVYFAPIAVNLGADTTLAAGDSLLLDARKPEKLSDVTYRWSTGDTTPVKVVYTPGSYWVTVTSCSITASDTIIVSAAAPAENPAGIGGTTMVNASDSLTVTASFDHSFNSNNLFTIQLLQGTSTGGKKAGEQEGEVTNLATIAGTDPRIAVKVTIPDTIPCGQDYHVRIVSSSPADTTDWSAKFAVVNAPVATVQQRGDSLFANKALTYQWYYNGAALAGATAAAIRAKVNGQYYVVVSNGGSCRSTSATVNMVITAVPDVNLGENVVRAFPNPTAGLVYIRFEKPLLKPVNVIVHDTRGNTLYRKQVKDQLTAIDLGTLPKGVYYLELAGYGKQKAMRIILQ